MGSAHWVLLMWGFDTIQTPFEASLSLARTRGFLLYGNLHYCIILSNLRWLNFHFLSFISSRRLWLNLLPFISRWKRFHNRLLPLINIWCKGVLGDFLVIPFSQIGEEWRITLTLKFFSLKTFGLIEVLAFFGSFEGVGVDWFFILTIMYVNVNN